MNQLTNQQRGAIQALWDAADDELLSDSQPKLKRALYAMCAAFTTADSIRFGASEEDVVMAVAAGDAAHLEDDLDDLSR